MKYLPSVYLVLFHSVINILMISYENSISEEPVPGGCVLGDIYEDFIIIQ